MSKCVDLDFYKLVARDTVLGMIQEGIVQNGLVDCDGNRIGQGAQVMLCCPGCNEAPAPGPDKDTTNKSMAWDVNSQEVSVTDTAGHKVQTEVLFDAVGAPPVNQNPAPTAFFGKSGTKILGEPTQWMRIKMTDGKVYKIPVYLDESVQPQPLYCTPLQDYDDTGMPAPTYDVKVFGVVKDGMTFDEFFALPDKRGEVVATINHSGSLGDHLQVWRKLASDVAAAYGIDEREIGLYDVKTSIGWVNLNTLRNFDAVLGLPFEWRVYGRDNENPDRLSVIHRQLSFGISTSGYPSAISPDCGFVDVAASNFYTTSFAETPSGGGGPNQYSAHPSNKLFEFYYVKVGDGEIVHDELIGSLNSTLGLPPPSSYKYIQTVFGVLDFQEAFGDARTIVNEDGAPHFRESSLVDTANFYSERSFVHPIGSNPGSLDHSKKTGWQLVKKTRQVPNPDDADAVENPTKTVHYISLDLDPTLITEPSNTSKQDILIG